jgi:hypothetical protein
MVCAMRWKTLTYVSVMAAVAMAVALPADPASAAGTGSTGMAHGTGVGLHNTYNKDVYPHIAQALDAGAGLIEIDVYADPITGQWRVNHGLVGQSNNCTAASTSAQLYTGAVNKNFDTCLDDLRIWGAAHPTHAPVIVKVELKIGFEADKGYGPSQFDALLSSKLGSAVYSPTNLLTKADGSRYASVDAAAQADAWPTRDALAGKYIFEIIPGTVEEGNPFDHLPTDVEYATWMNGNGGGGEAFPAVLGAMSGDPRTQYDADLRDDFVFFDGDASTYVNDHIDTSWYDTHHYLLVMTDAYAVSPALSESSPTPADAQARIAELAADHATIVSTDWASVSGVPATVLPRG